MAYSTSNPPRKMAQVNGSDGITMWTYSSADNITTVRGAGYFSNAGDLGMEVGDVVLVHDTAGTTTVEYVSAVTAGAATVVTT
jgi:hypothetical protein